MHILFADLKKKSKTLFEKTKRVTKFDDDLKKIVDEMTEKMYEYDAIGLAHNQVGGSFSIFVIDNAMIESKKEEDVIVCVNPKIKKVSKETIETEEGCLSVPGVRYEIRRSKSVAISAQDVTGKKFTIEGTRLLARALCHEVGHLNGELYIDTLPNKKRKSLLRRSCDFAAKARSQQYA